MRWGGLKSGTRLMEQITIVVPRKVADLTTDFHEVRYEFTAASVWPPPFV
jgi:hypothetical protein